MSNPSSVLIAMEATLEAIKQVRDILKESQSLPPSVYKNVEMRLTAVERELSKFSDKRSDSVPNLCEDDEVAGIWSQIVAKVMSRK